MTEVIKEQQSSSDDESMVNEVRELYNQGLLKARIIEHMSVKGKKLTYYRLTRMLDPNYKPVKRGGYKQKGVKHKNKTPIITNKLIPLIPIESM